MAGITDKLLPDSSAGSTPAPIRAGSDPLWKMINDREGDFRELHKRMDEDKKLYLLDEYEMTKSDGQVVPDVQNVTMNDARTYADRATAILNQANMQPQAIGDLSAEQEKLVEDWMADLFLTVDERLMARDMGFLYDFLIEQVMIRGRIASRNIIYQDTVTDTVIPDVLPLDTRYFTYEYNGDGLMWGCPKYGRSKAQLESEYDEEIKQYHVGIQRLNYVQDFWDKDKNAIFINKKKVKEAENTIEEPPFSIQRSGAGTMMMDEGSLKDTGESIYAPVRGLYPEVNRLASILQTLNMLTFAGGYQYESDAGEGAGKPADPRGLWARVPVERGGGYKLIPVQDIKQSTRLFFALLMAAVQRGSLPNLDYGNLTFPLSAVAISKLTQTKDAIFVPRLQAMSLYYQQTVLMLKRQYVKGGIPMKLGQKGIEREYKPADLDVAFSPIYKFYSTSPDQDAANTAIAQQQIAIGMPQEWVYRETMKVKDPAGLLMQSRSERAERGDLANALFRLGHSQITEAERTHDDNLFIEAELTLQQLEVILRNRAQGGMAGIDAQGGGQSQQSVKPLMPVFGGGGGQTNKAPEDMGTEDMEEREDGATSRETTVRKQTEEG